MHSKRSSMLAQVLEHMFEHAERQKQNLAISINATMLVPVHAQKSLGHASAIDTAQPFL